MPDRPEIVCICGSTRFVDEMRAANRDLTFAGVIVVAPGEADELIANEQKTALDALHLRKIDLADRVLVVNPGRVYRRVHEQGDRIRPRHRQADLVHRSRLTSRRFVVRAGNESRSASERVARGSSKSSGAALCLCRVT